MLLPSRSRAMVHWRPLDHDERVLWKEILSGFNAESAKFARISQVSCHLSELIATLDKTTSLCLLGSAKRQSKAHCDTRAQALRTVVFLATSLELKGQSRDCKASCHFRLCAKVLIIGSTASLEVKMPETVNFAKQTAAQISPSVQFPTNNYVLEMLLQVKPRCSSHCSRSISWS